MDLKEKFYDITSLIQQEFDRNLELYGDKIQCRKGCSKCCSQIFRITPLDGWIITEHIKSLPDEERNRLVDKAKIYITVASVPRTDIVKNTDHPVSASHPSLTKEGIVESLPEEYAKREGVACPALGTEGECTIYDARPVICRRFGMPIYDYKNPNKVHACELNFSDGEEITDPLLIPNQTEIGKKWDAVKEEFITNFESPPYKDTELSALTPPLNKEGKTQSGGLKTQSSTTIAEAIVKSEKD